MIRWLMQLFAPVPLKHPRKIIAMAVLLTLVAAYFFPRLYVSTDLNLIASQDDPSAKRRDEVNRIFGTTLVAAVVITGRDDPAEVRKAADELSQALSGHKDQVKEVFYKADIAFFERHALLFLPPDKLAKFVKALERGDVGIDTFQKAQDLPALIDIWADKMGSAAMPEDADPADIEKSLDVFGELVDEIALWIKDRSRQSLDLVGKLWTGGPSMSGTAASEGYLTDNDGKSPRLAVLFVQPANNSQAMEVVAPFTDTIRAEAARVMARHAGFSALVTGMPALTTDELRVVTRDILVTGVIAGLGTILIFAITFMSVRVTLFVLITLGLGLFWTTGLTAAVYGHLTMISGYFAAQLFGLGVAYTIYITSRFHETLLQGHEKRKALEIALAKAGPGVIGSALTAIVAFFAMSLSEFKGFSELGIIAGTGCSIILLANLTLLPAALLLWHPGKKAVRVRSDGGAFWGRFERIPRIIPWAGVAVCVVGLGLIPRIGFDYAVENLLPSTQESVIGLRLLNSRTDFTTNYTVSVAGSIQEAERLQKKLSALPTVARAESLAMFVPSGQKESLGILEQVPMQQREEVARALLAIEGYRNQLGNTTTASFAEALTKMEESLQDVVFAAKSANRKEAVKLEALSKKVEKARQAVLEAKNDSRVRELERQIFDGLVRGLRVLVSGLSEKGFGADDLPHAIRGRYLGMDQKSYAVIAFPKGDIANRDFFERYVADVQSVDPQATGHPVTHLAFTHQIHRGFRQAAIFAAIAVIILILLDFRRPREFGMVFLPVVIGGGWTALFLVAAGIKFNYANLMAIPILIGTGVDFAINLAHRSRQEGSVWTAVKTTGKAITVSGSTALLGFGSLILGAHWGVKSLGLVLAFGIASCLTVSLLILPALLERKKPVAKDHS